MEIQSTLLAANKHWTSVVLVTLLAGGVALLVSALQPQEYSSEIKTLIIQKQNFETDTYLAAKSAEKVGNNLAAIMNTSSFFEKVVAENSVDLSDLQAMSAQDRNEAWSKKVTAQVIPDSGLLEITAYDINPQKAQDLATAVAAVMTSSASEYHGGGDSIVIKVVDESITSSYPVRPNILANVAVAMALGFVLSVAGVFLAADVPFRRVLLASKKKRESKSISTQFGVPPLAGSAAEQPLYRVIEPTQAPRFEQMDVLSSDSEPVTMYDHIK